MKKLLTVLLLALLVCGCAAPGMEPSGTPAEPETLTEPDAPAEPDTPAEPDALEAQGDGTPLFAFDETLKAVQAHIEKDKPVAVSYAFYGEGGGWQSPLYGPDAVDALYAALSAVVVTEETMIVVSDSDAFYTFIFADGSEETVGFNRGNLMTENKYYTVENAGALDALAFPTQGQDLSLTHTHPDAAYRAFAAAFYDAPPVSLTVTVDGGQAVVTDADKIEEAFELLSYAALYVCDTEPASGAEGDGDAPPRTFVFAMADGTAYTYAFTGRNLTVVFPEPVGTRYYWVDDTADDLFALFD